MNLVNRHSPRRWVQCIAMLGWTGMTASMLPACSFYAHAGTSGGTTGARELRSLSDDDLRYAEPQRAPAARDRDRRGREDRLDAEARAEIERRKRTAEREKREAEARARQEREADEAEDAREREAAAAHDARVANDERARRDAEDARRDAAVQDGWRGAVMTHSADRSRQVRAAAARDEAAEARAPVREIGAVMTARADPRQIDRDTELRKVATQDSRKRNRASIIAAAEREKARLRASQRGD